MEEFTDTPGREIQRSTAGRAYNWTSLKTLVDIEQGATSLQEPLLRDLYREVCASWRMLVDVRFKLLGLVPAVSILLIVQLLSTQGALMSSSTRVSIIKTAIALFGSLTVAALYLYERRNSELHDDLIARGRRIEKELGILTGQFLGRKESTQRLFGLRVRHDTAINLIYGLAIIGWLLSIAAIWLLAAAK